MPPVKSLEEQVAELLKSPVADSEIESVLKSEGERLRGLIQKYIEEYYASYSPTRYVRYNGLRKALRIKKEVKNRKIELYFEDDDSSWGESVYVHGNYGFKPILIDAGWKVRLSKPESLKYRFHYYEGYHFLQSALDEFEKNNPYDLHVNVVVTPRASSEFSDGFKLRREHRDMYDSMGF